MQSRFLYSTGRIIGLVALLIGLFINSFDFRAVLAAPALDTAVVAGNSNYYSAGGHALIHLTDGTILKVGGTSEAPNCLPGQLCTTAITDAEVFNPTTGQWSKISEVPSQRYYVSGVGLKDGKALIAGGEYVLQPIQGRLPDIYTLEDTYTYDPAANTWTKKANMNTPRAGATTILLNDGQVLAVGGQKYETANQKYNALASTEIYNPATNAWTNSGDLQTMRGPRIDLQLLDNGKVLATSLEWNLKKVEIYDPATGIWSPLPEPVNYVGKVLKLPTNKVFMYGGIGSLLGEIYDPADGSSTPLNLAQPLGEQITLLDPYPVVAGMVRTEGANGGIKVRLYNLATDTFSDTDNLTFYRNQVIFENAGNNKLIINQGMTSTKFITPGGTPRTWFYQYLDTTIFQYDPPATALVAPAKLRVEKSANNITLLWEDQAATEDGYVIERKTSGTANWQEIGRTTSGASHYVDTTPPANTKLDYQVKAFKGSTFSLASSVSKLQAGALSVYRFYRLSNGTHFYTMDEKEKNLLVANFPNEMRYEGIAYNSYDFTGAGLTSVYRFYNTQTRAHFYTISESEKNGLITNWSSIYKYEGVAFFTNPGAATNIKSVYRFYNSQTKAHFYTTNESEKDGLIANWSSIYKYEGVAFHAY